MEGSRRETRNPTIKVVAPIDGEAQKLGFGEFADYTYVGGILTYKPKYVEFLMGEGNRCHLDREKFPEWPIRKNFGIASGEKIGSVERMGRADHMPTVGEEFGFLIIRR